MSDKTTQPVGTPSGVIQWGDFTLNPGDRIKHRTASEGWWERVVGLGPDGRLVTADPANKLMRYSDPTDEWVVPATTEPEPDVPPRPTEAEFDTLPRIEPDPGPLSVPSVDEGSDQ